MRFFLGLIGLIAVAIFYMQQGLGFYQFGAMSSSGYDFNLYGIYLNLHGLGLVALLLFEATLATIAYREWLKGKYVTFIMALMMALSITFVMASSEYEATVTSRSDRSAERNAALQNRDMVLKELASEVEQREAWHARLSSPKLKPSELKMIKDEEAQSSERAKKLRNDLIAAQSNSGENPTAVSLSSEIGYSVAFWSFILVAAGVIVKALMRLSALYLVLTIFEPVKARENVKAIPLVPVIPSSAELRSTDHHLQLGKVEEIEKIEESQPKKADLKVLEGGKGLSDPFSKGKVVPSDKKTAVFALTREAIKGGSGYHSADALHKMACAVATEWKWDHPGKFGRNSVGEAMQRLGYAPFKVRNVQTYDLGGGLRVCKVA